MREMVGQNLREAREAKGCTLEEAERATRIRAKYLTALEAGDFAALPSDAQARGFLRNYAQFLGLDVEQILAHYRAEAGKKTRRSLRLPPARAKQPEAPAAPVGDPPPAAPEAARPVPQVARGANGVRLRRPRLLSPDVLVASVVTLGLGLLLLWGGAQLASGLAATTQAALSPAPGALAGTPPGVGQAASTPPEAEATSTLPTPLATYTGVNLAVHAEQRLWLRVLVDGGEVFTGLLKPGESKEFVGQNAIELVTGNGRGTRVIWNGRDQGTLGDVGEVVDRLWTLEGMVIPTPTITPTPTETEPPTATPVPSRTPKP